MKNKVPTIAILVLGIFLSIFAFNCRKPQNPLSESSKNSEPVQNVTVTNISHLEQGVTVRFPATLVMQSGTDCIELFTGDDFKKYSGDVKHAAFAVLASESSSAARFEGTKEAVVTGRKIFVKDVTDTSKTCGIITGEIFEITGVD